MAGALQLFGDVNQWTRCEEGAFTVGTKATLAYSSGVPGPNFIVWAIVIGSLPRNHGFSCLTEIVVCH